MSGRYAYLDTSAFVKLVVTEPESAALLRSMRRWPALVSCTLLRAEAIRALNRSGHRDQVGVARRLFGAVHLLQVDEPLLDRAGELSPEMLRTLDAVHLAAALSLGSELAVLVTYDQRLAGAARAMGLEVASPGS
ncbi:MAG: type II toxin-antitoxin system VapC family toxin [Acidimicrobiales bacterium]